jgi:hypothetical protein
LIRQEGSEVDSALTLIRFKHDPVFLRDHLVQWFQAGHSLEKAIMEGANLSDPPPNYQYFEDYARYFQLWCRTELKTVDPRPLLAWRDVVSDLLGMPESKRRAAAQALPSARTAAFSVMEEIRDIAILADQRLTLEIDTARHSRPKFQRLGGIIKAKLNGDPHQQRSALATTNREDSQLAPRPMHSSDEPPPAGLALVKPGAWPPDARWHFRPGEFAFNSVIGKCNGKTFQLLQFLAEQRRAVTRYEILESVWRQKERAGMPVDDTNVKVHLTKVRVVLRGAFGLTKKIDPIPNVDHGSNSAWKLDEAVLVARKLRKRKKRSPRRAARNRRRNNIS